MADVQRYLVSLIHPTFPQRYVMIQALTLEDAQAMAASQVQGSRWTVSNVVLYTDVTS